MTIYLFFVLQFFSQTLNFSDKNLIFFSYRAGDTYAAIKDCYRAIKLDPLHVKSHFRLAKGLMDLKRAREAHECLLYFKDKFPRHANSHAVFLLQKDINVALEDMETLPDEGMLVVCSFKLL